MPNHYTTVAICSPGYEFDAARFNADAAKLDLCEVVRPMPDCLRGIVASNQPTRLRNKTTGEFWTKDSNGPVDQDGWERVPLESDELESLTRSVGASNWYDWCNKNWGTKWGTYGVAAFPLDGDGSPVLIKFQSAWGPPKILNEIAAWLCDKYGFESVAWVGFNPADDSTSTLGEYIASTTP